MSENLEKIINLIRKTGDKAIILDSSGDPSYVIMTVTDYERLTLGKTGVLGLTEQELLDKINRDVNIWKEGQNSEEINIDAYDFSKEIASFEDLNPDFYSEEKSSNFTEEISENSSNKEEDRYYFEPVE